MKCFAHLDRAAASGVPWPEPIRCAEIGGSSQVASRWRLRSITLDMPLSLTAMGRVHRSRWSVQAAQRVFAKVERARFTRGRQTFGERFGRAPVLILVTIGRRSGLERKTPLVYLDRGHELLISGGAGGVPWDPDWVHNLRACSRAQVLRSPREPPLLVVAKELLGPEKQAVWEELCRATPRAARYERRRTRPVPVFRLQPLGKGSSPSGS